MQPFSGLIRNTLPNYISGLPIPDEFTGWFKLSFTEWLRLIPPTAAVAGLGYISYLAFYPLVPRKSRSNAKIRLDEGKVVDMIDIEDITEKVALCRCWKSNNWPYCDGAHGAHNREHCDNLGPVVVKHKSK